MPESIRDGLGSGRLTGVTDENRLMIGGVTVTKEHHTNFSHRDAYNTLFNVTPTGAGDVFLYLKNTDADPIVCEGLNIRAASNEIIVIRLGVTGTPAGGAATVPANLTAGAATTARGVFQTGNDITGLTNGTEAITFHVAGSNNSEFRNFDADLVIPENQTLIIKATTGAIALQGFLVMWHDHGGV
jgi:hypothetical protein